MTRQVRQLLRITGVLALSLCLLAAVPAVGTAADATIDGFGVTPMRHDVDVSAGNRVKRQITITNTTNAAATYTLTREDIEGDAEDPAGTPVLLGGERESSISGYDWIDAPERVTIPAGGSRVVPITIEAPAGATGGHYAALVVTGPASAAGQLELESRIAVVFLMNAGKVPPPQIVITEVTEVGPTTTKTQYVNEGRTEVTPTGEIVVRDPVTHRIIRRVPATCSTALPKATGTCTFEDGGEGTTVADHGGVTGGVTSGLEQRSISLGTVKGDKTSAELPTRWAGSWSGYVLPLIGLALFVTYFLFLRGRGSGPGGPTDDERDWDDLQPVS